MRSQDSLTQTQWVTVRSDDLKTFCTASQFESLRAYIDASKINLFEYESQLFGPEIEYSQNKRFCVKNRIFKFLGILMLVAISSLYIGQRENLTQKASLMNLTGLARLKFSKNNYQLEFKKLSVLDETKINTELKKIHQITEKITDTAISTNGEIMITLAKSIDANIVLVVFKNQQIQMIQKINSLTEKSIDFQYGSLEFLPENTKILASQNIELEF